MTELNDMTSGRIPSFLILTRRFLAVPTSLALAHAEMTLLYSTNVFGMFNSSILSNNCIERRHCSFRDSALITNSKE